MSRSYYNENDPFAAQWLRNLISGGHLPPGVVDEQSIVDVRPVDLEGFTACHFFAGLGGWPLALRLAGWGDDVPVWSGSCPCQPFSAAGARRGADDPRHLWPIWFDLIAQCRPPVLFGEQVPRAVSTGWLDLVVADLESQDYAVGALLAPACAVGAPHKRDRLWFVAHAYGGGRPGVERPDEKRQADAARRSGPPAADAVGDELRDQQQRLPRRRPRGVPDQGHALPGDDGSAQSLANAESPRREGGFCQADALDDRHLAGDGRAAVADAGDAGLPVPQRHPLHGAGRRQERRAVAKCDWWASEPALGRMAHGIPGRVGQLRAYGNAIVPQLAAEVIQAFMEAIQ